MEAEEIDRLIAGGVLEEPAPVRPAHVERPAALPS